MSKYSPLGKYLNSQSSDRISITFAEIERILDAHLPASKKYPAWWSNNASNNVMTRQWLDAGYQTESVNTAGEKLVFQRVSQPVGFAENSSEQYIAPDNDAAATLPLKPYRSPIFGCMAGTVTIPDDVDLTEPAFPEWPQLIEEKYPRK